MENKKRTLTDHRMNKERERGNGKVKEKRERKTERGKKKRVGGGREGEQITSVNTQCSIQ